MNAPQKNDPQADASNQIDDLGTADAQNPQQVKGGFNPQPEPPKSMPPVWNPPMRQFGVR